MRRRSRALGRAHCPGRALPTRTGRSPPCPRRASQGRRLEPLVDQFPDDRRHRHTPLSSHQPQRARLLLGQSRRASAARAGRAPRTAGRSARAAPAPPTPTRSRAAFGAPGAGTTTGAPGHVMEGDEAVARVVAMQFEQMCRCGALARHGRRLGNHPRRASKLARSSGRRGRNDRWRPRAPHHLC